LAPAQIKRGIRARGVVVKAAAAVVAVKLSSWAGRRDQVRPHLSQIWEGVGSRDHGGAAQVVVEVHLAFLLLDLFKDVVHIVGIS
jgi:hypothetical protein